MECLWIDLIVMRVQSADSEPFTSPFDGRQFCPQTNCSKDWRWVEETLRWHNFHSIGLLADLAFGGRPGDMQNHLSRIWFAAGRRERHAVPHRSLILFEINNIRWIVKTINYKQDRTPDCSQLCEQNNWICESERSEMFDSDRVGRYTRWQTKDS